MTVITNIEDLRVLAEKRVPRMFYDYADSGSWTEGTYRDNEADFQRIKLRQRVAVNMEGRTTAVAMAGQAAVEEDARLAAEAGADAIVVSNHGGRQLDGAPSSISALPPIVAAVGSRLEVWMDGGIRSGQDVLKAWALGARGTMIGRAMVYGLGAMGEAGVTKALQIIHKELDVTMAFCGHTQLQQVDRGILLPGTYPTAG